MFLFNLQIIRFIRDFFKKYCFINKLNKLIGLIVLTNILNRLYYDNYFNHINTCI